MPILNYTTQIAAGKTVNEIQTILAKAKAQAVMSEYDDKGVLCALSFRIKTGAGVLTFRLPANVQKIYQVLVRQGITPKLRTHEQAARVAWRIIKDWLEAQLALVNAEMVDLEQVFLPYVQHTDGTTLYDRLKDRRFDGLALPLGGGGAEPVRESVETDRKATVASQHAAGRVMELRSQPPNDEAHGQAGKERRS